MRTKKIYKVVKLMIFAALGICISVPLFGKAEAPSTLPLRRFALIVGSNDGGEKRIRLQYATSDALAFSRVMADLGGVSTSDSILLLDPDYRQFSVAMEKMKRILAAVNPARERREFIIYFSGHSDEEGLLLGRDRYGYAMLRKEITGLSAEVHIAILDSCSSGALTRTKGGARRPAFLLDAANVMKGHAFLTSSSAEETAQESDALKASYFSHFLISGLRGAADTTGDGIVTLNEAYHYAFKETLASTEKTRFGAQHPTYDISLTGTGDIVLTDLRNLSAGVAVPEEIRGRVFIRDADGTLVVELNKVHGARIVLGLAPGMYDVTLDGAQGMYHGRIMVQEGKQALLSQTDLKPIKRELTSPKGTAESEEDRGLSEVAAIDKKEFIKEPFHIGFIPTVGNRNGVRVDIEHSVAINILWGESARIRGFEVGGIGNVVGEEMKGVQIAGVCNIVRGSVNGTQIAGLYNHTEMDAKYLQISGGVNLVGGSVSGVQIGGFYNQAGRSLQSSLFEGVQIGGLANTVYGDSEGVQLSGIASITKGEVRGLQIGSVMAQALSLRGVQLSVVNIGGEIRGAQLGVINIANSVRGTQLGVVNISKEIEGEALGLFTVTKDGQRNLEIWADSAGFSFLGFRMGSKHLYTLFSFAYCPFVQPARWAYGVGVGGQVPLERLFFNTDLMLLDHHRGFEEWYETGIPNLIPQARLFGGYTLFNRTKVYAGSAVQFFFPGWYSREVMADYIGAEAHTARFFIKPTIFVGFQF